MSVDVEAKYGIDMSDVRRVEGLVGARLPDILEPLRQVDADYETIKASLNHYQHIADEMNVLTGDLEQARREFHWHGDAGNASGDALDGLLTVLKYIGAIILFIVAALMALVAMLLYAIGALLQIIGKAIAFVAACVAVIVTVVVLVRAGGRGTSGRLTAIWETLKGVFSNVYMGATGIVGALGDGFGWVFEQAAKGVMWLSLWLIELGGKWTGSPADELEPLRKERNMLFGGDKD